MLTGLRNLSLASRIYRLSGTVILIFLLVIGWLLLQFRESLYEARRQEMSNLVESGWHILEFHAQQVANGSLSLPDARQRALQVIRNQRFEKENYFWIADLTPSMVLHPLQPDLEGRDLTDYQDPTGRPLFLEMAEVVKRDGAGFVAYLWPRPGEARPVAKISFVKEFPAWGWMIGAGFYVDDIDRYLIRLIFSAGAVLAAVIAGALLLVAFVSRSISVPMGQAVAMIEALENGDLDHRLHLAQRDEVGRLAKSLDAFADNLQYEILTAFDHLARGDFSFAAQGLIREPLAQTNARLNALVAKLDRTATEALEERTKTEALIAAIGEGVAIFDAGQKFVYQNPIHISLAGRQEGEPCFRAFHDCEHACADCAIARALGDGQIHKMERRVTVGGRAVYIDATASPVRDAAGKIISVIEIARDVTERKLAEEELKEKNAELERFTYTVSHDLKSPLVTIKAFLGYLKEDMAAADMERIDRDMAFMHTAVDKMRRLLDELLEMARVGRNVNPPVEVSLAELVAEALAAVAGRIAERGVEVRVEREEVMLCGDRPRLVEIWQNLIDNAVKYMGEQSAPCIAIGMEKSKGGPIFYVRDNGLGIEPGFHEKIFGLFEKLDPYSEGSGLGLALVKRIIEFNGGRIWVESSGVGQGSCFRFTLPVATRGSTG